MNRLLKIFTDFAALKGIDGSAHIVGGAVRDLLLNNDLKDVDIAVKGDAVSIAKKFASQTGSSFVLLDGDFGIARVVNGYEYLDICAMRGDTIYTDLSERDITINAMAILFKDSHESGVMSQENVIDPYNGRDDLRNKIVRMVSEKNLVDDPLRVLRVYRFAATLNFSIETNTLDAVKRLAPMITTVAAERIAEELRHILRLDNSFLTVKEMADDGILKHLFPETEKDKWEQTYAYIEKILNDLPFYFSDHAVHISEYLGPDYRKACLKFSSFFSSPIDALNASMRLKMSGKETDFIHKIAINRAVIPRLNNETGGRLDKLKSIRLLKEFQDDIYPLLITGIALSPVAQQQIMGFCAAILDLYHGEIKQKISRLPLVTGDDLIKEFNLKPSPLFKEILTRIDDMFMEGEINSREEALKKVEELIKTLT